MMLTNNLMVKSLCIYKIFMFQNIYVPDTKNEYNMWFQGYVTIILFRIPVDVRQINNAYLLRLFLAWSNPKNLNLNLKPKP